MTVALNGFVPFKDMMITWWIRGKGILLGNLYIRNSLFVIKAHNFSFSVARWEGLNRAGVNCSSDPGSRIGTSRITDPTLNYHVKNNGALNFDHFFYILLIIFCHNLVPQNSIDYGIFRRSHRSCVGPRFQFNFCPDDICKTSSPFISRKFLRNIFNRFWMD